MPWSVEVLTQQTSRVFFPKQNWRLRWGLHSCNSPVGCFQLFERFPTVLTFISSPVNFFSVRLKTRFFIQAWSLLFFHYFLLQTRFFLYTITYTRCFCHRWSHIRGFPLPQSRMHACCKLLKRVCLGANFEILVFSFSGLVCLWWPVSTVFFNLWTVFKVFICLFLSPLCEDSLGWWNFWLLRLQFWFEYQGIFLKILGCSA